MDRLLSDIELASLALAVLVFAVTLGLGYREVLERRGRPEAMTADDFHHYRRRDRRRSVGLSVLCVLALGIVVGSRTPPLIGGRPNPTFLAIWLVIFALIFALLTLSLVDWVALARYGKRKRAAMSRESLLRLREELEPHRNEGDAPDGH